MAGKEYTTAPILVNADGHPIPQYLDITDTTDSPQGTFKPLTQLQAEHPDVQNVQLTGSITKYIAQSDDVLIPAGATVEVISNTDVSEYAYIFVQVRPRGLSYYKVDYAPTRADYSDVIYPLNLLDIEGAQTNQVSEVVRPLGLKVSIRVTNNSEEDHEEFEVYLFGVRS